MWLSCIPLPSLPVSHNTVAQCLGRVVGAEMIKMHEQPRLTGLVHFPFYVMLCIAMEITLSGADQVVVTTSRQARTNKSLARIHACPLITLMTDPPYQKRHRTRRHSRRVTQCNHTPIRAPKMPCDGRRGHRSGMAKGSKHERQTTTSDVLKLLRWPLPSLPSHFPPSPAYHSIAVHHVSTPRAYHQ